MVSRFSTPHASLAFDDKHVARSRVIELFALAIADGFVSAEELALIYEKGKQLGLTSAQVDEAIQNPHRVASNLPTSLLDAITRLYDLASVIVTDGKIDPREIEVMRAYAHRFGVAAELVDDVIAALVEEVRAGTPRDQLIETLTKELAG